MPLNLCMSFLHCGFGMFSIADTFLGSGLMPSLLRMSPTNVSSLTPSWHFSLFSFKFAVLVALRTCFSLSSCSALYCSLYCSVQVSGIHTHSRLAIFPFYNNKRTHPVSWLINLFDHIEAFHPVQLGFQWLLKSKWHFSTWVNNWWHIFIHSDCMFSRKPSKTRKQVTVLFHQFIIDCFSITFHHKHLNLIWPAHLCAPRRMRVCVPFTGIAAPEYPRTFTFVACTLGLGLM